MIRAHTVSRRSVASPDSADLSTVEIEQVRRAVRFAMAVESANSVTPADLSAVDAARFAYAVERHRLEVCLVPHVAALNLPADVVAVIRARAASARMAAMAVAAGTIEVSTLLSEAGLRALIFKGCVLASQSLGDFTARGAGDVDVLVHPDDVEAAVIALNRIGFRRGPYVAARDFDSRQWQYARWATYELPLSRGQLGIDLHWHLTNVRSALPAFDDLWQRRDYVQVNNTPIPTLNLADALDHSCAHSLKDEWRWIRSLVDIDRLARHLPASGQERLSQSRAVHLSAAVALQTTGSRYLAPLATNRAEDAARVRLMAIRSQCAPVPTLRDRWTPGRAARVQRQQTELASTPSDWTRHLVGYIIPPSQVTDPMTGEGLPVAAAFAKRVGRVFARLAGAPANDSGKTSRATTRVNGPRQRGRSTSSGR